jgi:hypothetical protein
MNARRLVRTTRTAVVLAVAVAAAGAAQAAAASPPRPVSVTCTQLPVGQAAFDLTLVIPPPDPGNPEAGSEPQASLHTRFARDVAPIRMMIAHCDGAIRSFDSAGLDALTVLYNGLAHPGRPLLGAALAAYDAAPRKDVIPVLRAYVHDVAALPEANVAGVEQELESDPAHPLSRLDSRSAPFVYYGVAESVIQARWQSSEAQSCTRSHACE